MESISIASFVAFLVLTTAGAYFHYRKVRKSGRHDGTLIDYLIADHPARTGAVWIALIGSSWGAATSGVADFINPQLLWEMLSSGQIHIPSVNIAVLAITSGYAFDSALNKGGNE